MSTDLIQLIKQRRSIRRFQDKPVEKEIIEEILQAGRYAPSAHNRQPWRFIVIINKEYIQELSRKVKEEIKSLLRKKIGKPRELKNRENQVFLASIAYSEEDKVFFDAPVLILILTDDELFSVESCACCAQNMMLAAYSLGLGSCWIGLANILNLNKKHLEEIGVPEGYHIVAAIILGYPAEKTEKLPIRKLGDILKWID
ncbi:MAG TPA: nitroreductase family protein [Thermoplasmatales archaeon]|nr:nitroreductase family protein [Thermoplasmatales archaeon]